MNIIDLLLCLVLLLAVWTGWKRGLILQICSLVALVAAIWLAARYGATIGALLHIQAEYTEAAGFIVVLVVAMLGITILARAVRKIFQFAGFGLADTLLGILVAAAKYLLIVSSLFAAIECINVDYSLIPKQVITSSKGYAPVRNISKQVLPFILRSAEQLEALKNND